MSPRRPLWWWCIATIVTDYKMQPGKLRDYVDNNRANIAIAVSEFGALIDAINRNEDARNNQESKSLK